MGGQEVELWIEGRCDNQIAIKRKITRFSVVPRHHDGVLRSELMRLLPPDTEEVKPFLSDEVLDLYDTLCEVYLWGDWRGEDIHVSTSESTSWETADPRLEKLKAKIDRYLSIRAAQLRALRAQCQEEAPDRHELAGWLFLELAERDLVIWHKRDRARDQKG